MLRHPDYTRARIAQLRDRWRARIYPQIAPVAAIEVSPRVERIPYADAVKLKYRPVARGEQFGPLYATYWFRINVTVPRAWKGQRVDLLWDTHSEGLLWINGRAIEGLNSANGYDRVDAVLFDRAKGGDQLEFYIEMACNDAFGFYMQPYPQHRQPVFLDRCEIGSFDPLAWDIYHDLDVLCELEKEQVAPGKAGFSETLGGAGDLDKTWGGKLLFELNRFANQCAEDNRDTWGDAQEILKNLLTTRNADCVHHVSAIGHAHIDTAWLWPLAETHRKCVRTFSTQTRYMQEYPEYRFACSQAYQYWIVKDINPDLYARMRKAAKAGQWIPVGGTWIEPDCNIPSGEALCRQFLYGQRFFEREFGQRCTEFWNPDVFGYNGQLPQIMRQAGIKRFLTQKLSWNTFNPPLHQTFMWQGIDGSEVLAHFPPANTYNGTCKVEEMRRHARAYKENDRSREGMYLFGFGDGGCGPTKAMLERLRRYRDLQGIPPTTPRTSDEFFTRLEKDARDLPTVVGELYFELHRGTYTTQAKTKRGNRKSEFLLHDVEFLSTVAAAQRRGQYPRAALDDLWREVLLNQFHDILPGSSVNEVYRDAEAAHARIAQEGSTLRAKAVHVLLGKGETDLIVNTIGADRREVVEAAGQLFLATVPSYGIGRLEAANMTEAVTAIQRGSHILLENSHLSAQFHTDGRLLALTHKATGRQALAPNAAGNVLELSDDKPTNWEAWEVDPWIIETEKACSPASKCQMTRRQPLRAEVTFTRSIGTHSKMNQVVRLDAGAPRLEFHCDVDWQEQQKMLKVAFPFNVRALHATYEMQFGAVERPTHYNNTFALAQFEVPGHKWADLSEHGFGVALLSESKYGFSCRGNTLRMSLLRASTAPDPTADRGRQIFSYALYPHAGTWQEGGVVREALRFNVPLLLTKGDPAVPMIGKSFFRVDDANLLLDTVKQAEDDDAVILRLYECHGARGTARLSLGLPFHKAVYCNVLEDEGRAAPIRDHSVELPYHPYEIISLKLRK